MRKFIASVFAAICLVVVIEGCRTGPGQYNPVTGIYDTNLTADVFVVTAQNTRETALGVFDGLMTIEKHNEAALMSVNPAIHATAESVRKNGKGWLNDLTAAITAYQGARTPENASNLKSALAALNSALTSASTRLAESVKSTTK